MASSLLRSCFRPSSPSQGEKEDDRGEAEGGKDSVEAQKENGTLSRRGDSDSSSKSKNLRMNQSEASSQNNLMEIEVEDDSSGIKGSPSMSPYKRVSNKKITRFSLVDVSGASTSPTPNESGRTTPQTPKSIQLPGDDGQNSTARDSPKTIARSLAEAKGSTSPTEALERAPLTAPSSPLTRILSLASMSAGLSRASRSDSSANSSGSSSLKIRGGSRNREDQLAMGRALFSSFLKKCYSHEVLDYWDQSTNYIKLCKKHGVVDQAKDLARTMVQEFVVPNAPQKLDLGETIEDPLLRSYQTNEWDVNSFDATRRFLLKLLQGLRMDASVKYGVTSPTSQSIAVFLEEEERRMHQLMFQRDVHPLLHKLRKSTTFAGSSASGVTSGSGVFRRSSQLLLGGGGRKSLDGIAENRQVPPSQTVQRPSVTAATTTTTKRSSQTGATAQQ